jgi:hypothetical protein
LGSPRAGNITVRSLQRDNNPKIALIRRAGFFKEDPATHRGSTAFTWGLRFLASRVTPDFAAFITLAGAR